MSSTTKKGTEAKEDRPLSDRAALTVALNQLPGDYRDADYVVRAMREHFGDVFTEADEDLVRDRVKPSPPKPSTPTALAVGMVVMVLDWTRDPNDPVQCRGTIERVNTDGTLDVKVEPPEGIEPYVQTGLTEATGEHVPGQFRRLAESLGVGSGSPSS